MFGISKREIEKRISDKIIEELRAKGVVSLRGIGTLVHTAGDNQIRFQQDPKLLGRLNMRTNEIKK